MGEFDLNHQIGLDLQKFSREDLEDLLNDPTYFDAMFHSLPRVAALDQALNELASANESIASMYTITSMAM